MRRRLVLAATAALAVVPIAPTVSHADVAATSTSTCGANDPRAGFYGPHALLGIEFSSTVTGWAVGGDRVLRTSDGGGHWSVAYSHSGARLFQVDAYNDRDVWVLGDTGVVRTTDGGRTWHTLPARCPAISSVDFFSPRRGVAVAGKTLWRTTDGGAHWRQAPSPHSLQSVCFADRSHGWAGAHGQIYRTADGGAHWRLAVAGPRMSKAERSITKAYVQCAGPDAGWGELDIGDAAMNQSPHVGYHLSAAGSRPIFSEGYFPYDGLPPHLPSSPGSEPTTFSAIDSAEAAYVDYCGACGYGAALVGIVTRDNQVGKSHKVLHIVSAEGGAFLSATNGWVVGSSTNYGERKLHWRIEHTTDGGVTWTTQYQS